MPTIAHISDLHLQSGVPERQAQVEPILQKINEMKPDLVVISGDVTDDGWDSIEELKWAKDWLDARIDPPQMVLPGNHDVGNFHNAQEGAITNDRVKQWTEVYKSDVQRELGFWWVVGINSMLFGMGGDFEHSHFEKVGGWLNEAKICQRELIVFQHSPIFAYSLRDQDPAIEYWVGPKWPRHALWELITQNKVRLLGSGHVHQSRLFEANGVKIAWAPPASGTWVHAPGLPNPPMPEQTGFFLHHLNDDGTVESELIECAPMLKLYEHNPWP